MKEISDDIKIKFYEVLNHKLKIQDFEKWVYENKKLELELSDEIYTDLLSINYRGKYAHNQLENLIKPFIDNGEFETLRISKCLKSIIDRDENSADSIQLTYDLFCSGYEFLKRLGLTYGILIYSPPSGNYPKTWEDMTELEQRELLDVCYPEIITDARNVLEWLESRKIVIKDTKNIFGSCRYEDLRSEEENALGSIETIKLEEVQNESLNKQEVLDFFSKLKLWFQFKKWW